MARCHASAGSIPVGLCLFGGSPVLAQTTDRTGSQTQVEPSIPPEWKPDLVVASAKATAVCTPQGTVTAKIVAVVKNQSPKGTAYPSNIPMQIVVEVTKWWSTKRAGLPREFIETDDQAAARRAQDAEAGPELDRHTLHPWHSQIQDRRHEAQAVRLCRESRSG